MRPSKRTRKRKTASRPRRPKDYLAERTYRRIREKIYTGGFRPGEHLKEEVLVKEFGASRSVIRQALTSLTAEGLLVDRPKIGKFVAEFTEELIAKLVPIRIVLEQLAIKEAIANLTEDDARELRAIADNLRKPQESLADQDALDVALHRKIWSLTGNDELEKLLIRVVGPFHIVSNGTLASPYYRRNAAAISVQQVLLEREKHAAGHQPIVDALCRKDAEAATKAMAAHIAANYETPDEDFSKSVGRFLKKYLHSP
jgi:DNA-binding GntR family transcriptional regulator